MALVVQASSAQAGPIATTLGVVRGDLEANKDRITAICAREAPVPRTVEVKVVGRAGDREMSVMKAVTSAGPLFEIVAATDNLFTLCFAREATLAKRAAVFIVKPFASVVTLQLTPPDKLLKHVIEAWFANEDNCWPRPGVIPRALTIEISSDEIEMTVRATTKPSNSAVDACVIDGLQSELGGAGIDAGIWKPTAKITRAIKPLVINAHLHTALDDIARDSAASCIPPEVAIPIDAAVIEGKRVTARLGKMRVSVFGKRDDE